jgi:hypothetical protein
MTKQTDILPCPCAEQEENLVLLHYGELLGAERDGLETHLQTCAGCTHYLRDLGMVLPLTLKPDQPPERFWTDYSRELRQKLDTAEKTAWLQVLRDFFQPRRIPAFATAAVIALALAFTLGRGRWPTNDPVPEDAAMVELLPVAENVEFFNAMEVLDNLDLLESMGNQGSAT